MHSKIRSIPSAFLYWSGLAGKRRLRGARILTIHGTPQRFATEFQRQLRYLQRQFRIVPLAKLISSLEDPRACLDGMVALTFDDGLRSNVEVAYPILRKLGMPGALFICPGLIEERRWLWTHEMRCRLRWLEPQDKQELARKLGAPAGVDAFVEWMKQLAIGARLTVETTVRDATPEFVRSWADHAEYDLADWAELRALDPGLITFGCHTYSHPILPSMEGEDLAREIAESRRLMEKRLGRPVEFFAYPNSDHNALVRDLVRLNYRAAVSCGKRIIEHGSELHLLPRLDLPRGALRLALTMHRATPQFAAPQMRPAEAT
jgi:peptidoglycan/xylan/chitin deacetylase (PgdA/CDA1 family)